METTPVMVPVIALASDEGVDDREERASRERDTNEIETVQPAGTDVRDDEKCANEGDDADRNVHEEDPAPVEVRHDEAAERRTGEGRDSDDRAREAGRGAHALARKDRGEDRDRLRRQQRAADALDDAGGDELTGILREAAEHRRRREQHEARREQVARAEEVAESARGDKENGIREEVSVEHPEDRVERCLKAGQDARRRHIHDRRVEHDHKEAEADDEQRRPWVTKGLGHLGSSCARVYARTTKMRPLFRPRSEEHTSELQSPYDL